MCISLLKCYRTRRPLKNWFLGVGGDGGKLFTTKLLKRKSFQLVSKLLFCE